MRTGSLLDRLKAVNARPPPEEDLRVRVVVLVAVTTAALAVIVQGVGSSAFRVLVIGGLPVGYWYSWRTRYRQGLWLKVIVAAGALAALAWFVSTIAPEAGGTFADAQVPLAELLLLIQVLHGLDVPARRDLLFSLLSSAVLIAVAGALSVSMALVPYLVVWGVAAVAALVVAHHSELAEMPTLTPPSGERRQRRRTVASVAAVAALVVGGGLAIFFVVPPAGTSRTILFPRQLLRLLPIQPPGGLSNPSLGSGDGAGAGAGPGFSAEARAGRRGIRTSFGYLGFSTSLDLGVRGRPDNTVVMRVRADRPALWRGQTFDRWDGRTWTISDQHPQLLEAPVPIAVPSPAEDGPALSKGPDLVQTYYVARPGPNLIFGAAPISRLYFPDRRVYELPDGTVRAGVQLGAGSVYTVVSQPPPVTADILRRADQDPAGTPPTIGRGDAAPPVITSRVNALARQVTSAAPATYDKVLALEGWMAAHTRYTLDVPPLPAGADAVDQFLFVDRRGFCEQIASSLVVMLRSLGVPARATAGYAPGRRNPFTGLFEVRASDAHLWTEVWFPGVGWQSFDPTAVVPLAGDHSSSPAGSGLAAYLGGHLPRVPGWLAVTLVIAAAGVLIGAAGVQLTAAWSRRRRQQPTWADRCLARLEHAGAASGRPRHPSETVLEYAAALEEVSAPDNRLDLVADLVSRAAFSGRSLPDSERLVVERALDEIDLAAPRGRLLHALRKG